MNFVFENIFEDEFIRLDLDDSLGLVLLVWLQHPDSETYRRGFSLAGEVVLKHQCRYWLSDSRQIHYLEMADQNWILNHMAPMLGNSSLNKFARINSIEGLYLQDLDRVMQQLESSPHLKTELEIAVFLDMEESIKWLFSAHEPRHQVENSWQTSSMVLDSPGAAASSVF